MSRSGYVLDDCDHLNLYRGTVERSIAGERGQAFLALFAQALDALTHKRLIANELIDGNGEVCGIGAVCEFRGLDMAVMDYQDNDALGEAMGISRSMCSEIQFMNDEWASGETPEKRWTRMRRWIDDNTVIAWVDVHAYKYAYCASPYVACS